ncbi:hypothetical protein Ae168Ps1_3709 [Pseudonocardia sp. Ae168_Ps1]|uniref:DUF2334 domain-containing protein n=1 Tax=unclassified Pseudonocardia TaxID=2619320 RepID=UPI00095C89A0|nr:MULTISPECIES: DUF2334 domain-containing protein [unclassified Pseudonocardia]OLL75308.1 hypothetical protein Ae150APs1_3686 [Pseudonocardia sp. Ae150A_Ps1]OLL81303.1 hypothetical protein Ae168Ps1_3709 [Pseudonocardia sp. Ae168_Ps1]OLL84584.1 hypothetical protein Ae263Ps1_1639c [Pseudonocardia sp. Ae263_Ps1]
MSTLLVSLSGLTDGDDADRARAAAFAAELDRLGVPLTHLVQPKGPDGALRRGDDLVRWIAGRVRAGDDLLLHGYDHTADPVGAWQNGAVPRIGRRTEFGALPRHEAALRITGARRILAATGLSTDGFAPPRWAASTGTLEALADLGFALCTDETSLRVPGGEILRAKVLTFRSSEPWLRERTAGDRRRGRALEQQAVRTARRGGIVRIALRAKDLRKENRAATALAAIDAARAAGATPSVHRGLCTAALPAA